MKYKTNRSLKEQKLLKQFGFELVQDGIWHVKELRK